MRLIQSRGPPRCPRGAVPWPSDVVPDRLPSLAVDAARRAVAAKLQALDLAAEEPLALLVAEEAEAVGEARVMTDVEEAVRKGITYEREA